LNFEVVEENVQDNNFDNDSQSEKNNGKIIFGKSSNGIKSIYVS